MSPGMAVPQRPRDPHRAARRWALFLAMLISGGLLLFPRLPLLGLMMVLCLVATDGRLPSLRRYWPAFLLLGAFVVVTLVRPGGLSLSSLASRSVFFFGSLLLLHAYVRAPQGGLTLARDLRAILKWMSVQAIATIVLGHAAPFLFMPLQIDQATYQTFLLLFTYHITIEDASRLIRPDGFFFEPGVFQIYLNIYLFVELFVFRNYRRAALAVLAVMITQSTTGVMICGLQLATAFGQSLSKGKSNHKIAAVVLSLALAPAIGWAIYENINDKLYGTAQGSSWAREYDLFTGLNIIQQYPLLGIGFEVDRYLELSNQFGYLDTLLTEEATEDRPTSNGIIQLFYALGIPLGIPFLIGLFTQQLFPQRWLLGILFCMSLFGEALLFYPFFLMFIFSAFLARPRRRPSRTAVPQGHPADNVLPRP